MDTVQPVSGNRNDELAHEAPSLCIVVPCYNEEEVLGETASRLKALVFDLSARGQVRACRILFVDDGSIDETWRIVCELHERDPLFTGLKLSRNRGHQNALLAGLMYAKDRFDAVISLDADLQDDIDIIPDMLAGYRGGSDIVYAVRESRETDSFAKRTFSQLYYKVMEKLGSDVLYNHADYRLMSKRALSALSEFDEVNLFLRGLVRLVGYPSSVVYYKRAERFAGTSKYPLGKMLSFAFEGISSFSTKPLKFVTLLGGGVSALSLVLFVYFIVQYALGNTVAGWPSLIVSVWFLGGLMLLSLGIVGQYVGKIYLEVKHRPRYIVEDVAE
ncbi:glycosyltransferase family 2 protein [Raoultibacter phocaeensis]|uniref:glycosyltransferase family 2 protein n=1 Tax=Raoultibacter phocaeensis TaxID=2479841 RepID=UPI00111B76D2|nr:glycosyltransferase family 2 protein [Raoultibacter phocaeensis]